jgi:hypothetical protein
MDRTIGMPARWLSPSSLRRTPNRSRCVGFAESGDIRNDATFEEIALFLRRHEVHSVAMTTEMLGCPHEEGIDYPEGEACPDCPFWAGRDRPIVV